MGRPIKPENNEKEEEAPMEPLMPQAPRIRPDPVKKKPYSSERENQSAADTDKTVDKGIHHNVPHG